MASGFLSTLVVRMLAAWSSATAAAAFRDECDAAGGCSELVWRGEPYTDTPGDWKVYGGTLTEEVFGAAGFRAWSSGEGDDWDLLWTHVEQADELEKRKLPPRPGRLALHCSYFMAAGQKCVLARHINTVQAALKIPSGNGTPGKPYFLRTFELKQLHEHDAWVQALRAEPSRTWVVKGCMAGGSEGITLLNGSSSEAEVSQFRDTWSVAQEYLHDALTSQGRKFHARMYLLVTRWDPVGVFLYRGGLVFRSKRLHESAQPSMNDIFSGISDDVEPVQLQAIWDEMGDQRASIARAKLHQVLKRLFGNGMAERFGDPARLEERSFSCFDWYGIDVMFDQGLQPHVLEINVGPNMWVDAQGTASEPTLRAVKQPAMEQVASWASGRIALARPGAPLSLQEQVELETRTLTSFERIM
mmetsp:Transcript_28973/g.83098  ORF Transcript_28973/g.83098 Transcript_28973/m.83098 type:complete len:415 (-) Transcript_28973:192-1436(-)